MIPRNRQLFFAALILLALVATLTWRLRQPSSEPLPPGNELAATTLAPAHAGIYHDVPGELATILNETDAVRRTYLLATWVDQHTLEEVTAIWTRIRRPPPDRSYNFEEDELLALIHHKLADLNPEASDMDLMLLSPEIVHHQKLVPQTPRDLLLNEAKSDPAGAFQKTLAMRMPPNERDHTLFEILRLTASTDPDQALALLASTRAINPAHARVAIAESWAVADPSAALAWALTQPASGHFGDPVRSAIETWAKTDLDAAIEAATGLSANHDLDYTLKGLLAQWFAASPAASAEWIRGQPNLGPALLEAAFNALSGTHPHLAASLLERPMPDDTRVDHTATLVGRWAKTDPQAARQWLDGRPRDRAYLEAAAGLVATLAKQDPAAAFDFFRSLPGDANLGNIALSLADNVADKSQALSWLLSLPPSTDTTRAITRVTNGMNPANAVQIVSGIPDGPLRQAAYAGLGERVYFYDRPNLINWLRALPDAESQAAVIKKIGYYWDQSSPDEIRAFASELRAGPALDAILPEVLRTWLKTDPAAATDWLLERRDGKTAQTQLVNSLATLAGHAPDAALQRLGSLRPDDPAHADVLRGVVQGLTANSPDTAARTLLTQGTSAEQLAQVGSLTLNWSRQDASAATAWTRALPPGEVRDRGLQSIAGELSAQDVNAALALVPLATSDETRFQIRRRTLLSLQTNDDARAQATLDSMALSSKERTQLQEELDSYR